MNDPIRFTGCTFESVIECPAANRIIYLGGVIEDLGVFIVEHRREYGEMPYTLKGVKLYTGDKTVDLEALPKGSRLIQCVFCSWKFGDANNETHRYDLSWCTDKNLAELAVSMGISKSDALDKLINTAWAVMAMAKGDNA